MECESELIMKPEPQFKWIGGYIVEIQPPYIQENNQYQGRDKNFYGTPKGHLQIVDPAKGTVTFIGIHETRKLTQWLVDVGFLDPKFIMN